MKVKISLDSAKTQKDHFWSLAFIVRYDDDDNDDDDDDDDDNDNDDDDDDDDDEDWVYNC